MHGGRCDAKGSASSASHRTNVCDHSLFCKRCGVRSFSRGYIEQIGGDYVAIQVSCLGKATPEELVAAPVKYANGRDNSWWSEPAETRHL
jgi:hypothetical protein